jgi:hypothetical protein
MFETEGDQVENIGYYITRKVVIRLELLGL